MENDNGIITAIEKDTNAPLMHEFQASFPSNDEAIEGSSLGTNFDCEKSELYAPIISPHICNQNMWNSEEVQSENCKRDEREIECGIDDKNENGQVSVNVGVVDIQNKLKKDGRSEKMEIGTRDESVNDYAVLGDGLADNSVQTDENQQINKSEKMENENEKGENLNTILTESGSDSEEISEETDEKDERFSIEAENTSSNKQLQHMQTRSNSSQKRKHRENEGKSDSEAISGEIEEKDEQFSIEEENTSSNKQLQYMQTRSSQKRKNGENEDGDISERYLCYVCGKTYNQVSHLSRHTKSAHTKESFLQCTICDTTFTRSESFIRHLKIHEQRHGASTQGSTGPFKCPLCSKTYQQQYNVSRHLLTHYGKKPFQCPECDKTFTQHTGLSRHLLIHKGSRDFKCDICGKAFARQFVLSRHKLTHTEDKPYKCFACGRSFIRGSQLECHMKVHKRLDKYEQKNKVD